MSSGIIGVPGAAVGQLIGGVIVKKFDMKIRGILKYSVVCAMLTAVFASIMWLHCESPPIAGVTVDYQGHM